MLLPVNAWAVIVAAIAAMVIGSLWYSPILFGGYWMRLRGKDAASMKGMAFPAKEMSLQFVSSLVLAFFIAEFLFWVGANSLFGALLLGFWVWVAFFVTNMLNSVLWEKEPWALYGLNIAQRLVTILVMAAILGLWR